jgi:tRNA (cytidine32/uridine32-2'-O)-methyltransferase
MVDGKRDDRQIAYDLLGHIRIVMVNTTLPGNIGSAARAMKTMGLNDLVLVEPKKPVDDEAVARSSGATDILNSARVVSSLDEAIEDCALVIGTSARSRSIPWPLLNPRECAERAIVSASATQDCQKVAVLFGREDRGLTNEELAKCQAHVHIPTNPDYSSLNIASAIQVICYEMRMAVEEQVAPKSEFWGVDWDKELASAKELEGFVLHLEEIMVRTGFLDPENPRYVMTRIRRLFNRALPDKVEINVLRGILSSISKKLN